LTTTETATAGSNNTPFSEDELARALTKIDVSKEHREAVEA